jgi:hypothetical protein
MTFQLFRSEHELLVCRGVVGVFGIIVCMDYQLAVHRDSTIILVIKIEATTEALCRWLALGV